MNTRSILVLSLLCPLVNSLPSQVTQLNVETSCEIEGGDEIANLACHNTVFILSLSVSLV